METAGTSAAASAPNGIESVYAMPGHLIRRLNQIAVSIFLDGMARAGINLTPVQYVSLEAIHAFPGIDQATLAGLIAYDRVTVKGAIDRLEGKGFVHRVASSVNRRSKELTATPEGEAVLMAAAPLVRAMNDELLNGLSPDERQALIALLIRLSENLNERSRAPLRQSVPEPAL